MSPQNGLEVLVWNRVDVAASRLYEHAEGVQSELDPVLSRLVGELTDC